MRNLISIFTLITLLALAGCQRGGMGADKERSPKANKKIADQLFEIGSYYNAIDFYEKVIAATPDDVYVMYQLGESYYQSRDYQNAEKWYQATKEKDSNKEYPMAGYQLALTQKMNGKYETAINSFKDFGKNYNGDDASDLKKIVRKDIAGCEYAIEAQKKVANIDIKHLGEGVNAAYTEFAPMPMGEDKLFFSTLYSDTVIELDGKKNTKHVSRVFSLDRNGFEFTNRTKLPDAINDKDYHTGHSTFSVDGTRFYFTKCQQTETGKVNCHIYVSDYTDGKWGDAVKLESNINMDEYTSTHPTIGPYKKGAEVLYFVSDRPGGYGGNDIWYSIITRKGQKYGEPQNAGKKLNTPKDEITPYYDNKSKTFYFSSNGHENIGGFDIFQTEGALKKWTAIQNMGMPINSRVDDMYFVPEKNGQAGFLVSNRVGSIALKSPTCCDDIFYFEYRNKINVAVQGYVYDEADSAREHPMDEATVSLYIDNKDDEEDTEPIAIGEEVTKSGNMYFFDLVPNKEYKLSASKKGYFSGKGFFTDYAGVSTMGITRSDTLRVDLFLKKMEFNVAYRLKNIYYDFDKATLRPESKKTLDSLMMLLNEHASIKIELSSHTDSVGSNPYNKSLSQKRAESVMKYLLKAGIKKERLLAKGYGEEQPIAPNSLPGGGDNPEGRQLNRRTEFKIIGELENVEYVEPGEE